MKAYKGFNRDIKCRDFQYAEGGEYDEKEATLCNAGFNACEYYATGTSVYKPDKESDECSDETKRVAKKTKVGVKINVAGICKAQFEYVNEHCAIGHTDPEQDTAGEYGAALAGGKAEVSSGGVAVACGYSCYERYPLLKGGIGAVLIAIDKDNYGKADKTVSKIVDGAIVKADTWYALKDGKFIEVYDAAV